MPVAARLFVAVTIAVGAALLVAAVVHAPGVRLTLLALLAIAVLVTELMQVYSDDSTAGEPTHFSFSSGVHLAAVVVVGPWGAILVAALGVAFVDRLRGAPLVKVAFNAAVFAIATLAAWQAFEFAGGRSGTIDLPGDIAALAVLGLTAYAFNLVLVSTVVGLATSRRVYAVAGDTARGQGLSTLSEVGFGVALAYFLLHEPWAAIVLAPLLLGAYRAHALLERHRRETADALETLARIIDERDAFTADHSGRVASLVEGLARWAHLASRDVARLRWAGRLHDLGKVIVDTSVLHKPGRLDEREWAIVRRHPRISARILRRFELAADEAAAVEHHHERYDGHGYYGAPRSSIAAHVLTVADAFDAMTSDRPYRGGMSEAEALAEVERGSGTQFHPLVAKAFSAYVRGIPFETALDSGERRAFAALWSERREGRAIGGGLPSPQALGVSGAVAGLVLVIAGLALGAVAALTLSLACALWSEWISVRRGRLSTSLSDALANADEEDRVAGVVNLLVQAAGLEWAGLVAAGALDVGELQRRWLGSGPSPDALERWLARALGADDLVLSDGRDVGIDGWLACMPLGDRRSPSSYLVLQFAGRPPRAVADALRGSADALATRLGGLVEDAPAPRLTAVV